MSPVVADFLFELANFAILAGALGWFLFRPIRSALRDEQKARDEQIEQAAHAQADAEALESKAQAAMAELEETLRARRQEMVAEAETEIARRQEEAEAQHAKQLQAMRDQAETLRRSQLELLADDVGRIAGQSVQQMLDSLEGPSLDRALVAAACDRLAARSGPVSGEVVVEHARALDPEARRRLTAVLGPSFEARLVPALGAGVRIETTDGQLEVSARAFAREAARGIAEVARAPQEGQ